jgi:hypothetical protein
MGMLLIACCPLVCRGQENVMSDQQREMVDSYNYVIGTQTFSPAYQFTKSEPLLETARAIYDLKSTVIKFGLSPQYAGKKANGDLGNVREFDPNIHSLTDLVKDEPTYHKVLNMPFSTFILWAHTFSNDNSWQDGFSEAKQKSEYQEIYNLTQYLLTTCDGTGKTFYLGNEEGDAGLRHSSSPENDALVTPEKSQAMIDWLNTRQRAIDDAKRDTPHQGVQVWHYTEVNYVKLAMAGRKAVVSEVLPHTHVDYVSYACYDTENDPDSLKKALSYIDTQLPAKPGVTTKRVFIGEFGFPAYRNKPDEQDSKSRRVMQAGMSWGCPFVLYWQLYNSEVDKRGQLGYWMIDDKGVKQPIYKTYDHFYSQARRYVNDFIIQNGRPPSLEEYEKVAVVLLDK